VTTYAVRIGLARALELPEDRLGELRAAEGRRAAELADQGVLLRLWRTPDEPWSNLGLWDAPDEAALDGILQTLPLYPWMRISVMRLSEHPSDPALRSGQYQEG